MLFEPSALLVRDPATAVAPCSILAKGTDALDVNVRLPACRAFPLWKRFAEGLLSGGELWCGYRVHGGSSCSS